jgi:hypothetical protein
MGVGVLKEGVFNDTFFMGCELTGWEILPASFICFINSPNNSELDLL